MNYRAMCLFLMLIIFATGNNMPVVAQNGKHQQQVHKKKQDKNKKAIKDSTEKAQQKRKMVKDILKEKMNH